MIGITDISRHQGAVDFEVMASRGVRGVIIRLGNGRVLDDRAATYVPAAKAAGLWVCPYWFMNPTQDRRGRDQAARLLERASQLRVERKPMFDVESFANEPVGPFTPFAGNPAGYRSWLADAVAYATEEVEEPITYTGAPYWNGAVGGHVGQTDIFLARYPIYPRARRSNETLAAYGAYMAQWLASSPKPPLDADEWGDWIFRVTTARPALPAGYDHWDAWQFSAGYNRQGPLYGVSSTDLDLDIVRPEAWARWTNSPAQHVEVVPPPSAPARPPVTVSSQEDAVYFIIDGPQSRGSAAIRLVIGDDGAPHYQAFGFNDQPQRDVWALAVPHVPVDEAKFDSIVAGKV